MSLNELADNLNDGILTSEQPEQDGIFALFKGPPRSGKSVAAGSFPSPYVLDHDGKQCLTMRRFYPGKKFVWDNFNDIFGVGDKLNELRNEWHYEGSGEEKIKVLDKENCPHETVIGDSITSLSYQALTTIDQVKSTDIMKKLRAPVTDKKGQPMIELRGFDYYNGEDDFLKFYLQQMISLHLQPGNPKNVILIAHVITSESTSLSGVKTQTNRIVTAGNKIAAYIPSKFDEIYHFATESDFDGGRPKRICFTDNVDNDFASTALGLDYKIDFTNKNFYEILLPYLKGEKGRVEQTVSFT